MKEATQKNLSDAFAGESQAHMKYMIFAELAEKREPARSRAAVPRRVLLRADSRHEPSARLGHR